MEPLYFNDNQVSPKRVFCKSFTSCVLSCDGPEKLSKLIRDAKRFCSANLGDPVIGHALLHALQANRQDVIWCFVAEGTNANMWYRGNTLLHHAVKEDRPLMVQFLLTLPGADKDARNAQGVTPLMTAVCGHPRCLKVLLEAGCDINARDNQGSPALHQVVCSCGRGTPEAVTECLDILMEHGADINAFCAKGKTCLHKAVEVGSYILVSWLVRHNANVNIPVADRGLSLLACCQKRPYYEMGLSIKEHVYTLTPLYFAVLQGSKPILDLLMACGSRFRDFLPLLKTSAPTMETLDCLQRGAASPPPLMSLCRTVIRSRMSVHISKDVGQLDLPRTLEGFVLCAEELNDFTKAVRS